MIRAEKENGNFTHHITTHFRKKLFPSFSYYLFFTQQGNFSNHKKVS
jgi:hypothetical protein